MTYLSYDSTIKTKLISVSSSEKSIELPKTITEIAAGGSSSSPFDGCSQTESVSFAQGSSLTTLGSFSFSSTKSIKTVDFRNCLSLKAISYGCFYKSSIEDIYLPTNGVLESFLSGAFANSKIKSIKIPDSVKKIYDYDSVYGGGVFTSCYSLSVIDISSTSNLNYIGYAIAQNTIVEKLFIPKSITSLCDGAFNIMRKLSSLIVDEDNQRYCSIDNIIYNKDKTSLVFCANNKPGDIVVESTVTLLRPEAFRGYVKECEFVVPNTIKVLYVNTFSSTKFTKVILPDSLVEIQHYAFEASKIKSLRIPASVTKICEHAFQYSSSIRSIYFEEPETSLMIEDTAFLHCTGIESIAIPNDKITMDIEGAFEDCPNLRKIYYLVEYPSKKVDTKTRKFKYYAKMIMPLNDKKIECGDIEIVSDQNTCGLRYLCTQKPKSSWNNLVSNLLFIIFTK